jgi:hypothetical protein
MGLARRGRLCHDGGVRYVAVIVSTIAMVAAAPTAALATAPSHAILRLDTGVLALAPNGTGIAPATLSWTQGASTTKGVGCCTNDVSDAFSSTLLTETTRASWQTTVADGSGYSFRIDAYDADDAYVGTAFSDPPSYDDGFAISAPTLLTYKGRWHAQSQAGAWGGTIEWSSTKGAAATWQAGDDRAFELIMPKGPAYGRARISVGSASVTVNLHASTSKQRQIVFVRNYAESLTTPSHTVVVTNLGTHGHARVAINAIAGIETD